MLFTIEAMSAMAARATMPLMARMVWLAGWPVGRRSRPCTQSVLGRGGGKRREAKVRTSA